MPAANLSPRSVKTKIAIASCTLVMLILGPRPGIQAQDMSPSGLFDEAGKVKLRILLTKSPKAGRTEDFVAFLEKHFIEVATTDYEEFREDQAKHFDVVILDYGMTRPGSVMPTLSPMYSRATVTMGVSGSEVCGRLRLKPGYL